MHTPVKGHPNCGIKLSPLGEIASLVFFGPYIRTPTLLGGLNAKTKSELSTQPAFPKSINSRTMGESTFSSCPHPKPLPPGPPRSSRSQRRGARPPPRSRPGPSSPYLRRRPAAPQPNGHGSKSRTFSEHPNPTKIHHNGWCTYPKRVPVVLTHSHILRINF